MDAQDHDPEADDALRWRLELLKTKLDEGNVHFAPHLVDVMKASLDAVTYGPDGKINLDTVDGRVRSLALAAAGLQERENIKNLVSLHDISNRYFEFISKQFGLLADNAEHEGLDAHQTAFAVSRTSEAVEEVSKKWPDFLGTLEEYWTSVGEAAFIHIQELEGFKAIFGGDLFPSYTRNIASSVGLYSDTIVLSDPFVNSHNILQTVSDEQRTYYITKHAINALRYKDLAVAELPTPIVVLVPFRSSIDEDESKFLKSVVSVDGTRHASEVFGQQFNSPDDVWEFVRDLNTPEATVGAVSDPDRLLFDTEWNGTKEEQIIRLLGSEWSELGGAAHAGNMVAGMCFGRMGQATNLLMQSRYLMGTPLIDAPTSWKYFNWKLEYNAALRPDDLKALHMVKGLQRVAETDECWLGRIPVKALVAMRSEGVFEEVRDALSNGVGRLAEVNPTGFFRTSDQIVDNIRSAFDDHKQKVKNLTAKGIKFAGYDLGSMIVAGGLDIATIVTGTGTFGAASLAVNQLLDTPKLRELPKRFRELQSAHKELRKSPMGMLFKHR